MFSEYFSLIFSERQEVYVECKVLWMKEYDHDNHSFVMGYRTGILIMVLIYNYHICIITTFIILIIVQSYDDYLLKQHFQQ